MRTIFKYPLPEARGRHCIPMPEGARILSMAAQRGQIALWVECNPAAPTVQREFYVEYTGMNMSIDVATRSQFIGTVLLNDGFLVCHVYEVAP